MPININSYTPLLEGNFTEFVSSENQCKHVGENKAHNDVRKFQIDGGVLPKGEDPERCDYLLLNDSNQRAYFIELKGNKIKKAISQIDTSVDMIKASIPKYSIYKRIIYHSGTHDLQDSNVLKWKKHNNGRAVIKEKIYSESIN